MKKQRRVFDTTFKLEVVKLIKKQGVIVGQVCKDMSIGETAVRR
jgi:transposase